MKTGIQKGNWKRTMVLLSDMLMEKENEGIQNEVIQNDYIELHELLSESLLFSYFYSVFAILPYLTLVF